MMNQNQAPVLNPPTRVCCYGASRVGVLSMLVFARHSHNIQFTVVDDDNASITRWQNPNWTVQEVGIHDVIGRRFVNVQFNDNIDQAIQEANVIFLAVEKKIETQDLGKKERVELTPWLNAIKRIRQAAGMDRKLIVDRFPLLEQINPNAPNATDHLMKLLHRPPVLHDVLLNPMFFSAGHLIPNLEDPAAVLIARKTPNADADRLTNLYHWLPGAGNRITVFDDSRGLEFSVLAHNFTLGWRELQLSLLRTMADYAQVNNRDVLNKLARVDPRLAPNLESRIAVGGPEIQKSISCFAELASQANYPTIANFLKMGIKRNKEGKENAVDIMRTRMGSVRGATIAIFGFSYKEDTDDFWDSPALNICELLLKYGAMLRINDPLVRPNAIIRCFRPAMAHRIQVVQDRITTCQGAAAICILHMSDHQNMNFEDAMVVMADMEHPPHFFDFSCHLDFDHAGIRNLGFDTYVAGRPVLD